LTAATVFPWQADGPERGVRGVSGDQVSAREAAAECLRRGEATTARIEAAMTEIGTQTLTDDYRRTGEAWQARLSDGRVTWVPVPRVQLATS
jgi:hypothetical protein